MKTAVLIAAITLTLLGLAASLAPTVAKHQPPVAASASAMAPIEALEPAAPAEPACDEAAPYLLKSARTWRQPAPDAAEDVDALVRAIAVVACREPAVFGEPSPHAKTAVLLATLAFFESGWAEYVLDGDCNTEAWRRTEAGRRAMLSGGSCDGGLAWSAFQIHVGEGFVLTNDGYYDRPWSAPAGHPVEGPAMIIDSELAVRLALAIVRTSIDRCGGTLNCYAGAGNEGRAKVRLDFARSWWTRHPYLTDAAPTGTMRP
jgi:hypothetical protein